MSLSMFVQSFLQKINNTHQGESPLSRKREFFFHTQREKELGTKHFHSKKISTTRMQLSNTNISLFYRQKK